MDIDINTQNTRADSGTRSESRGFHADGPTYTGRAQQDGVQARPVGSLLRDFSREIAQLIRQEISLAKAEMREKVALVGRNAAYMVIGGVLLFAGILVFLAAVTWGLAAWMSYAGMSPGVFVWLAPLIVAVIV